MTTDAGGRQRPVNAGGSRDSMDVPKATARTTGLARRLRTAIPPWPHILLGAPFWGAAMALSAAAAVIGRIGAMQRLEMLMLLYCAGGMLAWPFAIAVARFCAASRRRETRFAAYLVALVGLTIAATAFLFAMDYRLFYARWHEPVGTRIWAYQFVYTSAAAAYQFVAIGIRLYLPVAAIVAVLASLWLSRRDPSA